VACYIFGTNLMFTPPLCCGGFCILRRADCRCSLSMFPVDVPCRCSLSQTSHMRGLDCSCTADELACGLAVSRPCRSIPIRSPTPLTTHLQTKGGEGGVFAPLVQPVAFTQRLSSNTLMKYTHLCAYSYFARFLKVCRSSGTTFYGARCRSNTGRFVTRGTPEHVCSVSPVW